MINQNRLQLEVGKSYLNEEGAIVMITAKLPNPDSLFPFRGDDRKTYSKEGKAGDYTSTRLDLVKEAGSST